MGAIQGAQMGMSIGESIGVAAAGVVNACIPQGTLNISCNMQSLGSVVSQFGASSGFSFLSSNIPNFAGAAGFSAGFTTAFGGGGAYPNSFPMQARSYFWQGSLVST